MPNYVESLKNHAQTKVLQNFAKGELEVPNAATYLNLLKVSQSMNPSHKTIIDRKDRIADSYMFARNQTPIGTGAPSHDHSNGKSTSMVYTPLFNPVTAGFSLNLKDGRNNLFNHQELTSNEFGQKYIDLLEGQEDLSLDFVYQQRSQVDTSNYPIGTWSIANSVYEIPLSSVAAPNSSATVTIRQVADSVMIGNNQKGKSIYFCDDVAYDKFMFGKAQGSSNNVNTAFEDGNVSYVRSSGLNSATRFGSVATYNNGVFVVMQVGTAGILDWIAPENISGVSNEVGHYSTVVNPLDKQTYALHAYRARINGIATGGGYQDQVTQFQIWREIAFAKAPYSTPNKTSLKGFVLV